MTQKGNIKDDYLSKFVVYVTLKDIFFVKTSWHGNCKINKCFESGKRRNKPLWVKRYWDF
jgi:hypothetical protein